MDVAERVVGDRDLLAQRVARETRAVQRDRLRAVLMALDGSEKIHIAQSLGRAKSFVEDWVYAYRDGGIDAIASKKHTGRPTKLAPEKLHAFLARVDAGPQECDGICTLRGQDLRRILREEFNANYSLNGVYMLMARMGYSSMKPRPIHEKHDPHLAAVFKETAPLLSAK